MASALPERVKLSLTTKPLTMSHAPVELLESDRCYRVSAPLREQPVSVKQSRSKDSEAIRSFTVSHPLSQTLTGI